MTSSGVPVPESLLQTLFVESNTNTLDKALENLIELSRTTNGRVHLASKDILTTALQLCRSLPYPSCAHSLLLSLKLLRNLCAGEVRNQNSFIEQDGVDTISAVITSEGVVTDSNYGIIRMGLQVLANVSLAGKEHQLAVWHHVSSPKFVEIARLRSRDTCDPLCMILYACTQGNNELIDKLGLPVLVEITQTASAVGFGEDWLKLLLSRTCIEESFFASLFSDLLRAPCDLFTQEQSFLLCILSEILNEQIQHISVSMGFASEVVQILTRALGVVTFGSRPKSGLPTGSIDIDVLGYSLSILRDICASDGSMDIVDSLLSSGILELLLDLLRDLEPPTIIRKTVKQAYSNPRFCPYKGFRSDIVAVIGNCAYRRKHVQDEIRDRNGVVLMLQQCVTDEENPFLREWGIWAVRNLLEGNLENQRLVNELEVQGSVELPELTRLGLRVEVNQQTRRAKLVNTTG